MRLAAATQGCTKTLHKIGLVDGPNRCGAISAVGMVPDQASRGGAVAGSASRIAAACDDDLAGIKAYASLVVIEFGAW